jgi:hypothetical protein
MKTEEVMRALKISLRENGACIMGPGLAVIGATTHGLNLKIESQAMASDQTAL